MKVWVLTTSYGDCLNHFVAFFATEPTPNELELVIMNDGHSVEGADDIRRHLLLDGEFDGSEYDMASYSLREEYSSN